MGAPHWSQYIFVDEVHKAGRNMARKSGKFRKGVVPKVPLSEHLGRSWTVVAAMNCKGLVAAEPIELFQDPGPGQYHAVNRALWIEIFERDILPHLGDASKNEPNSIVIIDNASLHWGDDVDETLNQLTVLCDAKGARVFFTPPFEPDANAIEWMFAEMNKYIARNRQDAQDDPSATIKAGLLSCQDSALKFVLKSQQLTFAWL